MKTPIDRERVATVLSQTHLVKELSGKDFKQALMQEMTQDDQSEVINNISSTPGFAQQGTNEEISNNNAVISSASSRKRQGSSVDMILVKDFPIKYKFDDLKIIFGMNYLFNGITLQNLLKTTITLQHLKYLNLQNQQFCLSKQWLLGAKFKLRNAYKLSAKFLKWFQFFVN